MFAEAVIIELLAVDPRSLSAEAIAVVCPTMSKADARVASRYGDADVFARELVFIDIRRIPPALEAYVDAVQIVSKELGDRIFENRGHVKSLFTHTHKCCSCSRTIHLILHGVAIDLGHGLREEDVVAYGAAVTRVPDIAIVPSQRLWAVSCVANQGTMSSFSVKSKHTGTPIMSGIAQSGGIPSRPTNHLALDHNSEAAVRLPMAIERPTSTLGLVQETLLLQRSLGGLHLRQTSAQPHFMCAKCPLGMFRTRDHRGDAWRGHRHRQECVGTYPCPDTVDAYREVALT